MTFCCRLGQELAEGKNILYESDNFFVVPAIGQMGIEGYILVCSKEHFIGVGNILKEYESELRGVLDKSKKIISEVYDSEVLVFEHGPRLRCHKGGGCLDHAHLHLVPTSVDVMEFLNRKFKPEQIEDYSKLREIYEQQKSSYIFVESQEEKMYVIEVEFPIPSQYLRQVIASKINVANWDWRVDPDYETFEKTVEHLKDKF